MRFAFSPKTFLTVSLMIAGLSASKAQGRCVVTFQSYYSEGYVQAYVSDDVDVMPQFPGGDSELLNYINSHRRYPREAYDEGIEGRVQCSFIVTPEGLLREVTVFRGVHPSLDREAVRLIHSMPKWIPGRIGDERVPVYYMLTIPFRR